jgi:hypothetical protein
VQFSVLIDNGSGWQALVKSSYYERCQAVFGLCELHLAKLYPESRSQLSSDYRKNLRVGMHPDRDFVLARLLASEFPLPVGQTILEGECRPVQVEV